MRIIITGANSYIGCRLQSYIQNIDKDAEISQLDVVGEQWREFDFSGYDTVVHVAAIVHRKDSVSEEEYNRVNAELTAEIAEKAKTQGVGQFVFLSTMAVYGAEKTLRKRKSVISRNADLRPCSPYGKSKYLAEQKLAVLDDESFSVAVVRPPNVYGPGCKGGYITTYAAIVRKLPAIPKAFTSVKQSVLYIDNLSRFIYLLITGRRRGIYTPQDDESVSAVKIMQYISESLGLKKKTSALLGLCIYLTSFLPLVRKGYGGIAYDDADSREDELDYRTVSVKEGIERTVLYAAQCDHSNL